MEDEQDAEEDRQLYPTHLWCINKPGKATNNKLLYM